MEDRTSRSRQGQAKGRFYLLIDLFMEKDGISEALGNNQAV